MGIMAVQALRNPTHPARRRHAAQRGQLGLHDAAVVDCRGHGRQGRAIGFSCRAGLALGEKHVAAPVVSQRLETLGPGTAQHTQGVIVAPGIQVQACEPQHRNRAQAGVVGLIDHPFQRGRRVGGTVLVSLQPRRQQPPMQRPLGAWKSIAKVTEDAARTLDVGRQHRAIEFVEKGCRLRGLVALVPVPAIPCGKAGENDDHPPGQEIPPSLPEGLERVELFLLLQIE